MNKIGQTLVCYAHMENKGTDSALGLQATSLVQRITFTAVYSSVCTSTLQLGSALVAPEDAHVLLSIGQY